MTEQKAYNLDCLDYMRTLPDKAFDLAVVDPPYGGIRNRFSGGFFKKYGIEKANCWDVAPPQEYFAELFRVSRNQIIFGGNYFSLPGTRCFIVWNKGNRFIGRSFAEAEYAWTSFDRGAVIFKKCPIDSAHIKIHPTQKPVELYVWILERFANPGDKILDTHLGSGSSRIAAYNLGFDFVGIELDADYFLLQERRFAEHTAQGRLFFPDGGTSLQEGGLELLL